MPMLGGATSTEEMLAEHRWVVLLCVSFTETCELSVEKKIYYTPNFMFTVDAYSEQSWVINPDIVPPVKRTCHAHLTGLLSSTLSHKLVLYWENHLSIILVSSRVRSPSAIFRQDSCAFNSFELSMQKLDQDTVKVAE